MDQSTFTFAHQTATVPVFGNVATVMRHGDWLQWRHACGVGNGLGNARELTVCGVC
jgi:hypothetical protein